MPLVRVSQKPTVDLDGDVHFSMLDVARGRLVECEADSDYLVAVSSTERPRASSVVFADARARIEEDASDAYDLLGPDERGVVELAPLIL